MRLLDATSERPRGYFSEQPFGQVPFYRDGSVEMFESGAIVLHVGEHCEALLPRNPAQRARAVSWVLAALNSVEPMVGELANIDLFAADAEWARLRRPAVEQAVKQRLGRVSDWLGEREYLEQRFAAGDLLMTTVLRNLRQTDLVADFSNLAAYQARCEARPAFQRALAAQFADFEERETA